MTRLLAAYAAGDPAAYPVKDASQPLPIQVIGVGLVLDGAGRVLIDQRLEEGLLGGFGSSPAASRSLASRSRSRFAASCARNWRLRWRWARS